VVAQSGSGFQPLCGGWKPPPRFWVFQMA